MSDGEKRTHCKNMDGKCAVDVFSQGSVLSEKSKHSANIRIILFLQE